MKTNLSIIAILICNLVSAQKVSVKKDTVYAENKPYALFKKSTTLNKRYFVYDLKGVELMELHSGRIELKGRQGYVVNFLNDMKQAMIVKDAQFPGSFLKELVSRKLIAGGAISKEAEIKFIAAHPLPDGYTDVEQLIEYDGYRSKR